jgi:hypothetical protein
MGTAVTGKGIESGPTMQIAAAMSAMKGIESNPVVLPFARLPFIYAATVARL